MLAILYIAYAMPPTENKTVETVILLVYEN